MSRLPNWCPCLECCISWKGIQLLRNPALLALTARLSEVWQSGLTRSHSEKLKLWCVLVCIMSNEWLSFRLIGNVDVWIQCWNNESDSLYLYFGVCISFLWLCCCYRHAELVASWLIFVANFWFVSTVCKFAREARTENRTSDPEEEGLQSKMLPIGTARSLNTSLHVIGRRFLFQHALFWQLGLYCIQ